MERYKAIGVKLITIIGFVISAQLITITTFFAINELNIKAIYFNFNMFFYYLHGMYEMKEMRIMIQGELIHVSPVIMWGLTAILAFFIYRKYGEKLLNTLPCKLRGLK